MNHDSVLEIRLGVVLNAGIDLGGDQPQPCQLSWGVLLGKNLVRNPRRSTSLFYRDIVEVWFRPTATAAERRAAIDSIAGVVVGGFLVGHECVYVVRIPPDSTHDRVFDAAGAVRRLPGVHLAMPSFVEVMSPDGWSNSARLDSQQPKR